MKKISVIMSVYKSDSSVHLERAILSILNQTFQSFTLYIMVDGPVGKPIDSVLRKFDVEKVKIFKRDTNKGLATSLNELIDIVMLDDSFYIARMDSDDYSHENRFEVQLDYFSQHESVTVLGSSCIEVDKLGNYIYLKKLPEKHDDLVKAFIKRSPFNHPTVMFKKSVFIDGIRYPVDVGKTEDYFLWAKLLMNGETFANVQEPLLDFTMTEETLYRRRGLSKAITEMSGRFQAMKITKSYSLRNVLFALAHFIIRISPLWLHRLAYKMGR